jgi:hypothetical protein
MDGAVKGDDHWPFDVYRWECPTYQFIQSVDAMEDVKIYEFVNMEEFGLGRQVVEKPGRRRRKRILQDDADA